jgi:hypothetical protein
MNVLGRMLLPLTQEAKKGFDEKVTLEMSLKRVILLGERMKKYMVTDSVSI